MHNSYTFFKFIFIYIFLIAVVDTYKHVKLDCGSKAVLRLKKSFSIYFEKALTHHRGFTKKMRSLTSACNFWVRKIWMNSLILSHEKFHLKFYKSCILHESWMVNIHCLQNYSNFPYFKKDVFNLNVKIDGSKNLQITPLLRFIK